MPQQPAVTLTDDERTTLKNQSIRREVVVVLAVFFVYTIR